MNARIFAVGVGLVAALLSGCATDDHAAAGRNAFTVMSYNVRHCEGVDGVVDIERIAEVVRRMQPRFAALQEVDVCRRRTGVVDQAAELGRLTGMVPTFAAAIRPEGDGEYGNLLLSAETPLSVRRLPLPGKEPRVLLLCEFEDCFVGTTHLSVSAESERRESVAVIREAAKGVAKPVFLAGDWNAFPDSQVLEEMQGFMRVLSDTTPAGGTFHGLPGQPSRDRGKCLDYIAIDGHHAGCYDVAAAACVEERTASDHAPVFVKVFKHP